MTSCLTNKIIISTRPIAKEDSIRDLLLEKGAKVLSFPMIKIQGIEPDEKGLSMLQHASDFDWIVFTSKNGVHYFFEKIRKLATSLTTNSKIAVIGRKTAEEVRKNGIEPLFISSGNTSEDFLKEFNPNVQPGEKLLLALGELAGNLLEKSFQKSTKVSRINVYKTIDEDVFDNEITDLIRMGNYDLILFTSPSGVRNFCNLIKKTSATKIKATCIGDTTKKEMLKNNLQPEFVSPKSDAKIFVNEIENYFNII